MCKYSNLAKETREAILEQMDELGEITTEDIMELIRPYYMFDIRKLRNQALRRAASSLMRSYKDDKGVRNCYSFTNKEGKSSYVDINKTNDLKALGNIELQLNKRYKGLNASKKKIKLRKQIILEQAFNEAIK